MTTSTVGTRDLTDLLDDLTVLAGLADNILARWVDDAPELESVDVLDRFRTLRLQLSQMEAVVERHTAAVMAGDQLEYPGGVAVRHIGKTRKEWAHEDLIHTVVDRIAVDAATDTTSGETDQMLAALIQDACGRFAITHRPEWRVTALREIGVDADEYCTAIPGRASVQITKAGPQ